MGFTTLVNFRTIVAFLSGLAIGLEWGLSARSSLVLESPQSEEQAMEKPVYGGQPVNFWIRQLKDRDPALRQQAMRALA